MSTIKQIFANRQNAQRSTGPRTQAGKAASRFNALRSGIDAQSHIIPGEDPAQLEALIAEYQARFDTSAPERRMLVDTLISCEWLFRRLNRVEASLWQYAMVKTDPHPEGRVLDYRSREFDRLQRRIDAVQRNYDRALKELLRLEPPEPPVPPQPNQQPTPENGFVPAIKVVPAVPPANPMFQVPPPAVNPGPPLSPKTEMS